MKQPSTSPPTRLRISSASPPELTCLPNAPWNFCSASWTRFAIPSNQIQKPSLNSISLSLSSFRLSRSNKPPKYTFTAPGITRIIQWQRKTYPANPASQIKTNKRTQQHHLAPLPLAPRTQRAPKAAWFHNLVYGPFGFREIHNRNGA